MNPQPWPAEEVLAAVCVVMEVAAEDMAGKTTPRTKPRLQWARNMVAFVMIWAYRTARSPDAAATSTASPSWCGASAWPRSWKIPSAIATITWRSCRVWLRPDRRLCNSRIIRDRGPNLLRQSVIIHQPDRRRLRGAEKAEAAPRRGRPSGRFRRAHARNLGQAASGSVAGVVATLRSRWQRRWRKYARTCGG